MFSVLGAALVSVAWLGCGGVYDRPKGEAAREAPSPRGTLLRPSAQPPAGPILYQPVFQSADGETVYGGAGFFTRSDTGRTVGVTSTEFLEMKDRVFARAGWFTSPGLQPVASFETIWGKPGPGVMFKESADARGRRRSIQDYRGVCLLMPSDRRVADNAIVELDQRERLEVGERVWFAKKDKSRSMGYELLEGTITDTAPEGYRVKLDAKLDTESIIDPVGAPVVSQSTGKAVGIVSGGGMFMGSARLASTPAVSIRSAISSTTGTPRLRDVSGTGWK